MDRRNAKISLRERLNSVHNKFEGTQHNITQSFDTDSIILNQTEEMNF